MRKFSELSKEEKMGIFEAWIEGEEIQFHWYHYENGVLKKDWRKQTTPFIREDSIVRIRGLSDPEGK